MGTHGVTHRGYPRLIASSIVVCCLAFAGTVTGMALQSGRADAATSAFQMTMATLPSGTRGMPYSATLYATGGNPPYRWSVASGTLPKGLRITHWMGFHPDKTTGKITGRPKLAGTWTFTLRVLDRKARVSKGQPLTQHSATQVFSITIS